MSGIASSIVAKLKSILYPGRHLVFILAMTLIFLSAGSFTVIWLDSTQTKTITGQIKRLSEPNLVQVRTNDRSNIELKIPDSAVVKKNDAGSRFTSLEVGDTVRIRYHQRHIGLGEVALLQARSPVVRGRIIEMDLDKKFIVLEGDGARVFYIESQTVILQKGSLAHLEDLKLGSMAKAEYRDALNPKLDFLIVDE